jgi:hypothetical protein
MYFGSSRAREFREWSLFWPSNRASLDYPHDIGFSRQFLGAFANVRKAIISFVRSVCPPAHPSARNHAAPNGRIFNEIWYFNVFRKPVKKNQVWLISEKNNEYFTWRHCVTSRKVAGSIPDGVIGIFYWHNSAGRTMALWLTQSLREMGISNISWRVKAAGV